MPKKPKGEVKQWTIEKVKLADVKPFDGNPRVMSDKAMSGLVNSLSEFGYVEPIVWNKRTGRIVGGHQRYKAMVERGVEEAEMVVVDFDDADELAANLSLNNPYIEGVWNDDMAAQLISSLAGEGGLLSSLNLDELGETFVQDAKESNPPSEKWDTECPHCGNKWLIQAKDIVTEDSK